MARFIDPDRRCAPVAEWPGADQAAWELALADPDPLDAAVGFARRWRPSTRGEVQRGYGRFLGWAVRSGRLTGQNSAVDLVSREMVAEYVGSLRIQDLGDYSVAARLAQLANALRAIAPGNDWDWITLGSSRVRGRAIAVRRMRQRLRPPEDILVLGLDMMDAAETDRFRTPRERATLFRDGLTLAFLVMRPVRISNLAAITLDGHLQKRGDVWRLRLGAEEMKGGDEHGFAWPPDLVAGLERYLVVHRPVLLRSATGLARHVAGLWVSRRGDAMTPDALSVQIRQRTADEFGEPINPHAFRHMAATTIATADPGNMTDVASVLAHSTLRTSEKHYNLARAADAARSYQETVRSVRRSAGAPRRDR